MCHDLLLRGSNDEGDVSAVVAVLQEGIHALGKARIGPSVRTRSVHDREAADFQVAVHSDFNLEDNGIVNVESP
jgi:hypothetical protein